MLAGPAPTCQTVEIIHHYGMVNVNNYSMFNVLKNLNLNYMRRIVLWLAFAFVVNACQTTDEVVPSNQEELTPADAAKSKGKYSSARTSDSGVDPVLWDTGPGGNVECEQVGDYAYSSGRINFNEGVFDAPFPPGFTVTVSEDGKLVSWSFDGGGIWCLDGISVIVKGGNAANVYTYPADVTGDTGLASPINASGGPAALSNLTLCYNLRECEEEQCYQDETAWAAGSPYTSRGNWATYTSKNAGVVTLYAGQTLVAGSVALTVNGNGTVTIAITLNAGWSLQDVDEPVKIQGYTTAPSGNPSPGLFTTYKGDDLIVTVPEYNYYGIHVDVRKAVDCPE